MMKLKVGHIFQAAPLITRIINEGRPLPQKGNYWMARLYDRLKPEHELIVARRNAMISAYDHKALAIDGNVVEDNEENRLHARASMQPAVPDDKMPEFTAAWADIANEEIEVPVQPIPLDKLSFGDDVAGSITANEFIVLADLVAE